MAVQNVTIRLSDSLYHQIRQRARRSQRSVEDEVVAVVEDALPVLDVLPGELADELTQMSLLTDEELWQAARSSMTTAENRRMQALLFQRQREGLSSEEEMEAERLAQRQERVMLVRAKAASILNQRGHDVSKLMPAQ
jgi:plasmid stability protein